MKPTIKHMYYIVLLNYVTSSGDTLENVTDEKQIDIFIFVEVTAFMNYLERKVHIISV
jgi:hypothetical protein